MDNDLKRNILDTICYYDVLNYPLTLFEIWKHLLSTNDLSENNKSEFSLKKVFLTLKESDLSRFIDNENGLYFLRGRSNLVKERARRNKISILKLRKMKKIISLLRVCPFVRMILVTGKLAMGNAHPKSDWDVLVVLKEGRIWTGRTFVTLFAHFLGKRRHHDKIRNRVCFNYFLATDSLEIRNKDLYSASEYFFCFPLFDAKNYFKKFQLRNHWIGKYKPNYYLTSKENYLSCMDNRITKFLRVLLENVFDHEFLEKYLEKIETKKIKENPKTSNKDSLVCVDRSALIFLPYPQGPKVFEKFKNRVQEFKL